MMWGPFLNRMAQWLTIKVEKFGEQCEVVRHNDKTVSTGDKSGTIHQQGDSWQDKTDDIIEHNRKANMSLNR